MSGLMLAEPQLSGTSWTALGCRVEVLVTDSADLPPARRAVTDVLDVVDRTLSRFRADSELSVLNRARESTVAVSGLLARALRVALDAANWTDGRVDPTIGRHLLDLGYDRSFSAVPATGPALAPGQPRTSSFRALDLEESDDGNGGVLRRPPGLHLDLGATGKGLAADLAAEAAVAAGVRGLLVNLGGDISVTGEPPDGGWPGFVTDDSTTPAPNRRSAASLPPSGQTVAVLSGRLATSGTSRRRWRRGGTDIHHIIDPATGLSAASPWRTVSVAAPTCVLANTASTAGIIRGAAAAPWLAATGLPARLVATNGEVVRIG